MSSASATPDDGMISERPQPPSQAVSGVILMVCALVAMMWANSPWRASYAALWQTTVGAMSLGHFINDGLMALFFLLVGLEIKQELQSGALASWQRASLPVVGAIGGMLIPAALFVLIARGTPASSGWGIPMATDIAFALGIVALLGERVPAGLRIFLAALAIADDIGAVLVIALFYTPALSWSALAVVAFLMLAVLAIGRRPATSIWWYVLLGSALWFAVLRSGVHASIAGVLLAFVVPTADHRSVGRSFEHALQHPVAFIVLPLFAFANAGVALPSTFESVASDPAVVATAIGLLVGKPLGIFSAAWVAVRLRVAMLPSDADWYRLLGVAALGGIGFTMSLFIAALAFNGAQLDSAKIGVLAGSLGAGILGAALLVRPARASVSVVRD